MIINENLFKNEIMAESTVLFSSQWFYTVRAEKENDAEAGLLLQDSVGRGKKPFGDVREDHGGVTIRMGGA
ncbi:MAG: hypothetical protein MR671_05760 [Clostridiales bacterium]|nr:hypothetical protein [Clostridiales bacterium]